MSACHRAAVNRHAGKPSLQMISATANCRRGVTRLALSIIPRGHETAHRSRRKPRRPDPLPFRDARRRRRAGRAGGDAEAARLLRSSGRCLRKSGTPDIENLYARRSGNGPHLMFAGHTDVVPAGDEAAWTHPPFAAEIADGEMYGRGAVDMKGGIACFVAAVARHIEQARRAQGLGLVPHHRRRGRPGDQRHGQAARLGGGKGETLGRGDRRRADQSGRSSAT